MPDDRPASKAGTYCISAIDNEGGATALAAGMAFQQALELRDKLRKRWPDVTFIVEPDSDSALFTHLPAVYQLIGVNKDCSRTPLMAGMTLEEAEAARDELVEIGDHIWVWIEREPH